MKNMKKLLIIAGGSALLVLCILFGAFFAGPLLASAHSTQDTASKPAAKSSPYCQLYNQDLAKSLGVSTDTLNQDRKGAFDNVLAQMVKDGKLTQAQANTIEQNRAKKQVCNSFRAHAFELRAVHHYLLQHRVDLVTAIAQGLHMSKDQLAAQLKSGQTLDQIATAQKVSHAQLVNLLNTTITNQVNKGVSSGDLTKDQDNAFQQFVKNHPNLWNRLATRHWHVKKA